MNRSVSWVCWHLVELAAVAVPAVAAVVLSAPLLLLVSGAVAVTWAVHEARVRAALRTDQHRPAPTNPDLATAQLAAGDAPGDRVNPPTADDTASG